MNHSNKKITSGRVLRSRSAARVGPVAEIPTTTENIKTRLREESEPISMFSNIPIPTRKVMTRFRTIPARRDDVIPAPRDDVIPARRVPACRDDIIPARRVPARRDDIISAPRDDVIPARKVPARRDDVIPAPRDDVIPARRDDVKARLEDELDPLGDVSVPAEKGKSLKFETRRELESLIGRKVDEEELMEVAYCGVDMKRELPERKAKNLPQTNTKTGGTWKRSSPDPVQADKSSGFPSPSDLDDEGQKGHDDHQHLLPPGSDLNPPIGVAHQLRSQPAKRQCFQVDWEKYPKKNIEKLKEKNSVMQRIFMEFPTVNITRMDDSKMQGLKKFDGQSVRKVQTSTVTVTSPVTSLAMRSPAVKSPTSPAVISPPTSPAVISPPTSPAVISPPTSPAVMSPPTSPAVMSPPISPAVISPTSPTSTAVLSRQSSVPTIPPPSSKTPQRKVRFIIPRNQTGSGSPDILPNHTRHDPCVTSGPQSVKNTWHAPPLDQVDHQRALDTNSSSLLVDEPWELSSAVVEEGVPEIADLEFQPRIVRGLNDTAASKVRNDVEIGTINIIDKDPREGYLVWCKLGAQPWWPAMIITGHLCGMDTAAMGTSWVMWFGDHKISMIPHIKMLPFAAKFSEKYLTCKTALFAKSINEAIKECARRMDFQIHTKKHPKDQSKFLLAWAKQGFLMGDKLDHSRLKPDREVPLPDWAYIRAQHLKEINDRKTAARAEEPEQTSTREGGSRLFRIEMLDDSGRFSWVRDDRLLIEDVCLSCEGGDVVCEHPYFSGGLCETCKEDVMKSMFVFGGDGLNMFCVICANAGELFVCDRLECSRVYCTGCVTALVSPDAVQEIREQQEWRCFLCVDPEEDGVDCGLLRRKRNWKQNVIQMYRPLSEKELRLPTELPKRPLRVLSLFDGIGTGKLVLDMLDLDVEVYYASEIDSDAITVAKVRHGTTIQHVGDILDLDEKKLAEICPVDLVIGGSPCNELSLCNPARKGLEGGSGLLFFEYYRVLSTVKLLSKGNHVFWVFENVASMLKDTKTTITRYFGFEPALWDAIDFSAQKRARYFWGNIPGLYCPYQVFKTSKSGDLEDSLMGSRKGNVNKIRCVTTRTNSLMQGTKDNIFPVKMGDMPDKMWIPELERVFGFPEHYTDVADLPPTRRQKLIGKAWSIPVIKHLLRPLRQFYQMTKEQ